MKQHKVLILGAGAAGAAAARVLNASQEVEVTVIGATGEAPYNRTLVNKGVAVGLLTPEQARVPGLDVVADTVDSVDPDSRTVHLASGATTTFDALVVATGSAPRALPATVRGADVAGAAGLLTTLHSLQDAVRVRDRLAGRSARVVIFGAGLVAAETATLLRDRGHQITLVARTDMAGTSAFGDHVAARLRDLHERNVTTQFGRAVTEIDVADDILDITLDDSTHVLADLGIVAHGTSPSAPGPWYDGVPVDDRLRSAHDSVYAAGGVAVHDDPSLGTWRIDHWADAAAQGEHAAKSVLHDLGLDADPGAYLPRSAFTAQVYGTTVAAVGLTGGHTTASLTSDDPLVVQHEYSGRTTGVSGVDSAIQVFEWMPRLHAEAHV